MLKRVIELLNRWINTGREMISAKNAVCFVSYVMLALFSILGFKAWTEIFYWFSGAVSFSFPLSVAMLAIVLYIRNKNMVTYVTACILTFLASGGSLEVAGTNCFGILMILFVKGYKKLRKKDYIFLALQFWEH